MLVLSREMDKSIVIGDNIVVTVVDIRRDKVRLGIECPVEIPVHRREIFDMVERKRLEAKTQESSKEERVDFGEQLNEYLSTGNYLKAYKVVFENPEKASYGQLSNLALGLGKKLLMYESE